MGLFSKIAGAAKESFNEQMSNDRAQGAAEDIDKRAAEVQERGRDMLGTDGVFNASEEVLIVGVQRGEELDEHKDKVNSALTALSKKMMDSEFVVSGEGKAQEWPQERNRLVVLTDHRLLLLERGQVFKKKDIRHEVQLEDLEGFSHERSMKGEKLIVHFKDKSSIELAIDGTEVEAFQYRYLRIPGRPL